MESLASVVDVKEFIDLSGLDLDRFSDQGHSFPGLRNRKRLRTVIANGVAQSEQQSPVPRSRSKRVTH